MPRYTPLQRNAGAFLDQAEGVSALMPKATRLLTLRRILLKALPSGLARSCSIANAVQGKIVLFADNSVIAAKLKLLAPTLRDQFLKAGVEATSVVVQVQPPRIDAPAVQKHSVVTEGAARALRELSAQLPDSELKEHVVKLASRARTRNKG